jgi:hypothetical protein
MLVAGIIIQLAYLGFSWNRQLYLNDQAKNEANQNLITAFSIVGSDIKRLSAIVCDNPRLWIHGILS